MTNRKNRTKQILYIQILQNNNHSNLQEIGENSEGMMCGIASYFPSIYPCLSMSIHVYLSLSICRYDHNRYRDIYLDREREGERRRGARNLFTQRFILYITITKRRLYFVSGMKSFKFKVLIVKLRDAQEKLR